MSHTAALEQDTALKKAFHKRKRKSYPDDYALWMTETQKELSHPFLSLWSGKKEEIQTMLHYAWIVSIVVDAHQVAAKAAAAAFPDDEITREDIEAVWAKFDSITTETVISPPDLHRVIAETLTARESYAAAKVVLMMLTETFDETATGSQTTRLIRRNGRVVAWSESRVEAAVRQAFVNCQLEASPAIAVAHAVTKRAKATGNAFLHIEDVQDMVEEVLMAHGHTAVARHYILYRAERARLRDETPEAALAPVASDIRLTDGSALDRRDVRRLISFASVGLDLNLKPKEIEAELTRSIPSPTTREVIDATIALNSKALIEKDADFALFAARILLSSIYREVLGWDVISGNLKTLRAAHRKQFLAYLYRGIEIERLAPELLVNYSSDDLDRISAALDPSADLDFDYLGVQTMYDRYLIVDKTSQTHRRMETPQFFWMRVAMGLCKDEQADHRAERAIALYNLYKGRRFCSSTPTLFNSGTRHSQLSSCYLHVVDDSIDSIFTRGIRENAELSKWAGGLGGSWTKVRGTGAYIKGTNGESQGVIPFLKVFDAMLNSCNQGGKRSGSGCIYLETWHCDIQPYTELRKNTGDERLRTHDTNTANWIPDLFMKRMEAREKWTLFRSNEVPDLHDLYGKAFERRYEEYERLAAEGKIWGETIQALDLWKKMLQMLFETGHPWITFKDPCNVRSPQDHAGVIHSSNLCCIAADQRVLTPDGMLTVGEMYEKDTDERRRAPDGITRPNTVIGRDGAAAASPMLLPRPQAEMARIDTVEGYIHKVTPDHKVWVKDTGWTPADQLVPGDKIELQQHYDVWGPENKPVEAFHHTEGVPDFVWRGDRTTAIHFLAGNLERDGDVFLTAAAQRIRFNSGSVVHLRNIQLLLLNMGIKSQLRVIRGKVLFPTGGTQLHSLDVTSKRGVLLLVEQLLQVSLFTSNLSALRNSEGYFVLKNGEANHPADDMTCTFRELQGLKAEDAYCLTVDNDHHDWTVNGMITKNTEITLNTSAEETAVCNLGSVILDNHVREDGTIDEAMLKETVTEAVRALDNVIDINFYPVEATRTANMRHRPIGLGVMGLQNALYKRGIPFASQEAVEFNDEIMELVAFYAYSASCDLAAEKGAYSTFAGSKWSRGILPQDTIDLLQEERGIKIDTPRGGKLPELDWKRLRERIKGVGMRNSNVLAIAPTATISNIMGTTPCIEPNYKNLYVKSNLSGDFTVLNGELVRDLKKLGLWSQETLDDLKYHDGEIEPLAYIPEEIKLKHRTVFGVPYEYIIDAAERRGKWIDQSQSVNLFLLGKELKVLSHMYRRAWSKGLKTTYYLRTLQASNIEKVTVERRDGVKKEYTEEEKNACSLDAILNGGSCEACQ